MAAIQTATQTVKLTIQTICDSINNLITKARIPMVTIPSVILVCSAINRPGLSPMLIASNIIRRQSEAGITMIGHAADGGANIAEIMERIRVEEMVKALKMDSNIQIGMPIGGVQFMGTGANAGGQVVINGFNVNSPHGIGILG